MIYERKSDPEGHIRIVAMKKLLILLKLPFLAVREVLILVLKYGYGCRVEVPYKKNKMGNEVWRRK